MPGTHDWYDGLQGFAVHFCRADLFAEPPMPEARGPRVALLNLLWRRPEPPDRRTSVECEELRPDPLQVSGQPGPYFVLETGSVDLVGVDTGTTGGLDREQGAWLRRVSRRSGKPKVLVLGKPIYANGEYEPREIEGGGTVDDVVRDPGNNYMAVVSGDKHNYQRYPVRLPDGRVVQHLISGGGGAFTHTTHKIPRVDLPGVTEEDFVCYPGRGDSLSFFSRLYDRRLGMGRGLFYVPPEEATAIMAEKIGVSPTRPGDSAARPSDRSRRAAARVYPLPGQARGPLHRVFEELFDRNDPPLFKNYLRVEVAPEVLTISCVGVTGCLEHEQEPPIEDRVEIPLRYARP